MTRSILVVDDDPGMVRTLCDILRLRGWESHGVLSGEEAVTEACSKNYNFVLMDIMMPGMDGVSALKGMKVCHPDSKVILMTAHAALDRMVEAEQAGAMCVMTKPLNMQSLLQMLN